MNALRGILGAIRQADQKFDFFHEKDRIMIGISGGKDSMVLALALSKYAQFKCANFEIVPAILDLGFPGFDAEPIKEYLKSIGLELKVIDSKEVFPILKAQQKSGKNLPCSICSRMKKAAINKAAKELGCNKVAFAHHGDDAIETLFMNEIFGGRVATFQPKMYLERSGIEFVRPLILVHEKQIKQCVKEENVQVFPSHCPNEGVTTRKEMKDLLEDIYQKYPTAKSNFFTMLENYKQEQLYYPDFFYKVERKDLALKPIILANDSRKEYEIRAKLGCLDFASDYERYLIYKKDKVIGVMSLLIKEDELTIHDLELIKESDKVRKDLLLHLENYYSHLMNPLTIYIDHSSHNDFYKSFGYKKARKNGLSKKIS